MNRRHFLRAAGACLALPAIGRAVGALPPRRLLAIHVPLGMMPQFFFPGAGGASSPYLDLLAAHRPHFTTFAGLSHPSVDGNHHAGQCFLSGAPHPGQPTFHNSLSLDQLAAEHLGLETRFPSLAISVSNGEHYGDSIEISRSGVMLPAEKSAERLYRRLFVAGTPEEKAGRCAASRRAAACSISSSTRRNASRRRQPRRTGPASTSISRACVNWRDASSETSSGKTAPNPWWIIRSRKTSPTTTRSSRARG